MSKVKNEFGYLGNPNVKRDGIESEFTKEEIVEYLSSGFTPDYDVAGGKMASVVENTSRLSESDRIYIAEYLLRLNDE